MSEKYTYPDGSQVVGSPPWPKLSPLQRARGEKEPAEPEVMEVEAPEAPKRKPGRPKKEA